MTAPASLFAPIPYRLRRSARARHVRIRILPDGVEVVAPPRLAAARIAEAVEGRRDWIMAHLARLRRAHDAHPGAEHLEDGAHIPLRGRPTLLRLIPHGRARVQIGFERDEVRVRVPADLGRDAAEATVTAALVRALRTQARADAEAAIGRFGPPHGLVPRALRIRDARSLWGSCTARGDVHVNWRLVLAPPPVLDYVVVHELCHLRERHHQPAFWRLVAEIMPDYARERAWLRQHGALLTLTRPRLG